MLKSFGQYKMDDRPSVTVTDRRGIYEMNWQTNHQKWKCHCNWSTFIRFFFTGTRMCYYTWSILVAFPCFCTFPSIRFRGTSSFCFCVTLSVHPFHRHFLYNWICQLKKKEISTDCLSLFLNHFLQANIIFFYQCNWKISFLI